MYRWEQFLAEMSSFTALTWVKDINLDHKYRKQKFKNLILMEGNVAHKEKELIILGITFNAAVV